MGVAQRDHLCAISLGSARGAPAAAAGGQGRVRGWGLQGEGSARSGRVQSQFACLCVRGCQVEGSCAPLRANSSRPAFRSLV